MSARDLLTHNLDLDDQVVVPWNVDYDREDRRKTAAPIQCEPIRIDDRYNLRCQQ